MNQPNIRAVQAGSARTLIVTWTSGVEHIIDVGEIIDRFVVFELLRTNDAAFQAVRVGGNGGCVQWTEAMELSTDALWRLRPELAENDAWLGRVCKVAQDRAVGAMVAVAG